MPSKFITDFMQKLKNPTQNDPNKQVVQVGGFNPMESLRGSVQKIGNQGEKYLDQFTGKYQVDATNQANRELAEYQWEKELEMWNLQNEYNSPASQMQRYKEAGLNPNLIYGQGSSGNAGSMPHYNRPEISYHGFDPSRVVNTLSSMLNIKGMAEKVKNMTLKNKIDAITAGWHELNTVHNAQKLEAEAGIAFQKNAQEYFNTRVKRETFENQIKQSELDTLYKEYEKPLRQLGISNKANPWAPVVIQILRMLGINPQDAINSIK